MPTGGRDALRELLQEFVEARVDPSELLARAAKLLPTGTDAGEVILELLAEADLKLRLPAGRQAFVRRLEQWAEGEISYTGLDLWCFSLGQTETLADDAAPATPEIRLLRTVVDWIEEWAEEAARPAPATLHELAQILAREPDPVQCLARLEEALARPRRD